MAILPGRPYYETLGKNKLMATILLFLGFPVLLPYYGHSKTLSDDNIRRISFSKFASLYIPFGLLGVGVSYVYSVGLLYLPLSIFSILFASHLAFYVIFSHFLNANNKFTPFTVISLVLLTLSSTLLGFSEGTSLGFICTIIASAAYGLAISLTRLYSQKIHKEMYLDVVPMVLYHSMVAICAVLLAGLPAIVGVMYELTGEKNKYYIIMVGWAAISWQIYAIGVLGLICEVSALFSQAISVLCLPIVPTLAVIFFNDRIDEIKAMSLLFAIWGFISHTYQQYLDAQKSAGSETNAIENSADSCLNMVSDKLKASNKEFDEAKVVAYVEEDLKDRAKTETHDNLNASAKPMEPIN